MTPREVLESLVTNLVDIKEIKGWTYSRIGIYTQDFGPDETVLDVIEIFRELFSDLDVQVVITSDGLIDPEGIVNVDIRFV